MILNSEGSFKKSGIVFRVIDIRLIICHRRKVSRALGNVRDIELLCAIEQERNILVINIAPGNGDHLVHSHFEYLRSESAPSDHFN
jgi:hypothetical protein